MKKVLLAIALFAWQNSWSQSWQDTVAMIEKAFERYKPGNPGCQLAIARKGQLLFSRSWGMADLEHGIALTNESRIEAGSVSKQFTAAAILLLEQQGKLSLNDDVRKYIPELPAYGSPITLRHMMQHTSGLKDWGSVVAVSGWPRSTKTYDNDDALYVIARQKSLNHEPGAEYIYSNSNYNLFAIIVERVSGKSLAEFSRINIFGPAGMTHTEWRDNFKRIVTNRAMAYEKSQGSYYTNMPNEYVYGNGGLLTTAEDLLKWNNYYLNGKLGNPSLLDKQLRLTPFNNGSQGWYAAGLVIDSIRGWKTINHNGATASYRANLEYFPDLGLSIAFLSNTSEFDGSADVAGTARNIFVRNLQQASSTSNTTGVTVPIDKLNRFAGWYKETRTGSGVRLSVKDGKLANSRGGTMIPVADNVFMIGATKIVVEDGKTKRLHFISRTDTLTYTGTDSARTDAAALSEYFGEYYSEEAEAKFSVIAKDGKLFLRRNAKAEYAMTPTYKDGFTAGPISALYFERDRKNKISGFKVSVNRARNISFRKL